MPGFSAAATGEACPRAPRFEGRSSSRSTLNHPLAAPLLLSIDRMIQGYNLIARAKDADTEDYKETRAAILNPSFASATSSVAAACVCPRRRQAVLELFQRSAEEEQTASARLNPLSWCERVMRFLTSESTAPFDTKYLCAYGENSQELRWLATVEKARQLACFRNSSPDNLKECFNACVYFLYTITSRCGEPSIASLVCSFLGTPGGLDVYCFIGALISSFTADGSASQRQPPQSLSKQSRGDAEALACLREGRSGETFLRLVSVYDNLCRSEFVVLRGKSHRGIRSVQAAVVEVAAKLLVHAASVPAGISIRLWSIFALYSKDENREASGSRRGKADFSVDTKRYTKKNSHNILLLTTSSVRSQAQNVVELRATVDCFREAMRSKLFLQFLRTELLSSTMGLLGTCISSAADLQKQGDDMALSVVAELLVCLITASSALRRHAVAQMNRDPANAANQHNGDDTSSAAAEPLAKRARQSCKLSSAAAHFPFLLQACASQNTEACVYMGAFLESCFVTGQRHASAPSECLGVHLSQEDKTKIFQAFTKTIAAPCDSELQASGEQSGADKGFSGVDSCCAQRRAACLSLLGVMADCASFASEVQQILLDLLADAASRATANAASLGAALDLALDLLRCCPRLRESALRVLRQEAPHLLSILAQTVVSATTPRAQRRLLLLVFKMLTEVLPSDRRLQASSPPCPFHISYFFLPEPPELSEPESSAVASPRSPFKAPLGGDLSSPKEPAKAIGSSPASPLRGREATAPSMAEEEASEDVKYAAQSCYAPRAHRELEPFVLLPAHELPFHMRLLPLQPCQGEEENADLSAYAAELAHAVRLRKEQHKLLEDAVAEARTRADEATKLMQLTVSDQQYENAKAVQEAQERQKELDRVHEVHRAELARVRSECEAQTRQLRSTVTELQALLEGKDEKLKKAQDALATSKQQQLSSDGERSKLHRHVQTLTALNRKQKDDLTAMEARCGSLHEANQKSVKKLHDLSSKARKLEVRPITLVHADKEAMVEEQEKLFKQLILLLDREQQLTMEQKRLRERARENLEAAERAEKLQEQLELLRHEKEHYGREAGQMASRVTALQTEVAALKGDLQKETERRKAAEGAASHACDKTQAIAEELERVKLTLKTQAAAAEDLEKVSAGGSGRKALSYRCLQQQKYKTPRKITVLTQSQDARRLEAFSPAEEVQLLVPVAVTLLNDQLFTAEGERGSARQDPEYLQFETVTGGRALDCVKGEKQLEVVEAAHKGTPPPKEAMQAEDRNGNGV
ncbi:hypothetical protein BESB_063150 [Besnoitia besnoiti]|uniref:Uncharacterized protein n=1 Tax=Besnoitia besnoiti TaxID=94643 RepID=A0A2A9MAD3_BESBE|nr:hypothetical protein BESB_063150 [Besnoitia besnoiti]PFH35428.1 hypothetical protein BESB_063150 [Besnoitia besnoiti]